MKHNLKFIRTIPIATALLFGTVMAYAADQSFSPAAACNSNASAGLIYGSQGQITNPTTSVQSAFCSVGQDHALDSNDDVLVYYQDATTAGSLFCGVVRNSTSWSTVTFGDQKWGCASAGGCTVAPANSFTGTGYLRLADIMHGGDYISTITCNIPRDSVVRALRLDEQ